jgi:hypothetical protein
MAQVAQGVDPSTEKRVAKIKAAERGRDTIDRLATQYLDWQRKRLRPNSLRQLEHIFTDLVVPEWQGREVYGIERRNARELTEAIAETRPIMANRVHGGLTSFFGWLCSRDIIAASPWWGCRRQVKSARGSAPLANASWSHCGTLVMLSGNRRDRGYAC